MSAAQRLCRVCGEPIHKSKVPSWGWMHNRIANHDHLPVLKKEVKTRSAEVESMFYYGDTPWHGQGTKVDHVLTAAEAIAEAGLDWEVKPHEIYTNNAAGQRGWRKIAGRRAMVRSTDAKVLSVLGENYTPVQNIDAFSFFDEVVASKIAKYALAGSLMGGRLVWILADLNGGNGTIDIKGDAIDKKLLLMNGHDGTTAFKMFFTPIRVVCWNTLMAAESSARQAYNETGRNEMFYARHSGTIHSRIDQGRDVLGISLKFFEDFAAKANAMATKQLKAAEMPLLLAAAFGTTGSMKIEDVVSLDDFTKRRKEQMVTVTRLFDGEGKGLDREAIKHTRWAAYNAIVEYIDYGKKYGGTDPKDTRLLNAISNRGATIKRRAWEYLLK